MEAVIFVLMHYIVQMVHVCVLQLCSKGSYFLALLVGVVVVLVHKGIT